MKRLLLLVMVLTITCCAISKPMESVTNYNVMLLHGAYGHWNSDGNLQGFEENVGLPSAYDAGSYLGKANIGRYVEDSDDTPRLNHWLSKSVFEEPEYDGANDAVKKSYIYHWRAFSEPPNTSLANAYEMGDRTWNRAESGVNKFGGRRALFEEAQEVKANVIIDPNDDSKNLHGQEALDSMRHNPDLYRQLASRYILIGHSMGGVVSREYVQGNFYNGDVDKIITLDSPHEGTGALNMLVEKSVREEALLDQARTNFLKAAPLAAGLAATLFLTKGLEPAIWMGIVMMAETFAVEELGNAL
ncbi:esterase/lipase family protein, partial [Fibrobacter sp.]|uniref:esterase/lipase family protein n=1 Tax=Fibrobacter sp. TaxID=35828 RepID=UPI00388E430B